MILDFSYAKLTLSGMGIIPVMIDENLLVDNSFIVSKDFINKKLYNNSSMGSYIRINDEEETEINADFATIDIKSSIDKIQNFVKILQIQHQSLLVKECALKLVYHLNNKDAVQAAIKKRSKSEILNCKAIVYKKDAFELTMFECSPGRLHLSNVNTFKYIDGSKIAEFDVNIIDAESYEEILIQFLNTEFELNVGRAKLS